MPKYSFDIEEILFEEDVRRMYDLGSKEEALWISFLWLTAGRPQEILKLKPEDIAVGSSKLTVTISTLKKKKKGMMKRRHRAKCPGWKAHQPCHQCWGEGLPPDPEGEYHLKVRQLSFTREFGLNQNIYLETIANAVQETRQGDRILPYGNRWGEKAINRLGMQVTGHILCPYHFRHSVCLWLRRNGWSPYDIRDFKGAESITSVDDYVRSTPQLVELENLNRNKHQPPFIKSINLPPRVKSEQKKEGEIPAIPATPTPQASTIQEDEQPAAQEPPTQ